MNAADLKAAVDAINKNPLRWRTSSIPTGRRWIYTDRKLTEKQRKKLWKKKLGNAIANIRNAVNPRHAEPLTEEQWMNWMEHAANEFIQLATNPHSWTITESEEIPPVDKRYQNAVMEEVWMPSCWDTIVP